MKSKMLAGSSTAGMESQLVAIAVVRLVTGLRQVAALHLQRDGRDLRDGRLDPRARVVVQIFPLQEPLQLAQRILRAAGEEGRVRVGLTRADVIAGDVAGVSVGAVQLGL